MKQAACAMRAGNLAAAEALLRAHLRQSPRDVAALHMLADIGLRLRRFAEAEQILSLCLELSPQFLAARHLYAVALYEQSLPARAMPHIEMLLAHDGHNRRFRRLLAAAAAALGDDDRAIAVYEGLVSELPGDAGLLVAYGNALRRAGRRLEAVGAYRQALAARPGFGEARWSLANLKDAVTTAEDVADMRRQLAGAGTGAEDRVHLHYALGRALEQAQEFAESFEQYAQGAALRRRTVRYDAADNTALTERIAALFTPAFLAARGGGGCGSDAPIFIVGLPRSGSTLVEQILASHSAVEGTAELPELPMIAAAFGRGDRAGEVLYPAPVAALDGAARRAAGEAYVAATRVYRRQGRRFFIDKMPSNFVHVGLISLILPRARVIDVRRDPMAAGFAVFKQLFARGHHFSYSLTEIGQHYRDYVALMDHFDFALPGFVHRVRYEDLVADTEGETRRLLAFLGLEWEDSCLRFHENKRAVRTASSEQVRRPVFTDALDHWRNYEPWLGPLRKAIDVPR